MKPITWGIILLVAGALLLLQNLDLLDAGQVFSTGWPIILILWGLAILRRKSRAAAAASAQSPGASALDRELIQESHLLENIYSRVNSRSFKGGSVSSVLGSALIDLSDATVAEGEHELRIHSMIGDTRLILPKGLAYSLTVNTVLGTVWLLGQRRGGFASEVRFATDGFAAAPSKLTIAISKIIGDLTVEQQQ